MEHTVHFRIFRGEHQYVADCLNHAIVTQAPTLDELAANIFEATALHLEDEDGLANWRVVATMELPLVPLRQPSS